MGLRIEIFPREIREVVFCPTLIKYHARHQIVEQTCKMLNASNNDFLQTVYFEEYVLGKYIDNLCIR